MPTMIEMLIVGMWAIVTDGEMDCRIQPMAKTPVTSFAVMALDPGFPNEHEPVLWIRLDSYAGDLDRECYKEKGATTIKCSAISSDKDKWWARWELRGKELKIPQAATSAWINTGERKVKAGSCWDGDTHGAGACKMNDDACKIDASWVPEYSKASGDGVIDPEVLSSPQKFRLVSAIAKGLVGELQAGKELGKSWKWRWNYPTECSSVKVPAYEQYFSKTARLAGVQATGNTIQLLDIGGYGSEVITIQQATDGKAHLEIFNDQKMPHIVEMHVDGVAVCLIPHFEAHHELLLSEPLCRRVPYWVKGGDACLGLGTQDPVCPPVVLKK